MSAFNLVTGLQGLTRRMRDSLADVGGARSPEMRAVGNVVAKHMRKTLSVKGGGQVAQSLKSRRLYAVGGTPSAPGQPPRAQTRTLSKSVKAGVVGTGIRVGPLRFTSLMLEEGVNAVAGTRKTRTGRGGRRRSAGKVKKTLRIAARPFVLKTIESAGDSGDAAKAFGDLAGLSIKAGG